jgi:hypothetical protein
MSNQLVISSGAKVRNLDGVLTGSTGIVGSVPLGAANGVATLDALGKVPLSQLPASVVTYLGTWNAATNTPTLANGTGDTGDLYICNVAGTVNFGAGPITFSVGDWVIYSGTTWERSAGSTGTVTSVAVTESGDALTITGSPITTSGTINLGFAGNSGQYVNGAGDLTTFPSLTGFVPYTGANASVDLGIYNLSASLIDPKQIILKKDTILGGSISIETGSGFSWFGSNDTILLASGASNTLSLRSIVSSVLRTAILDFSTISAATSRTFTLPDASGTLALTSNLSSYVPYTGATANVNLGTFDLTADVITGATGSFASSGGSDTFAINHSSGSGIALNITKGGNGEGLYINKTSGSGNAATIIGTLNATTLVKSGGTSSQFLKADGSVDSNTYVTLDTTQTISGAKTFSGGATFTTAINVNRQINISKTPTLVAYTGGYITNYGTSNGIIYADGDTGNLTTFIYNFGGNYNYTFPAASGTIALTSNLSAYVPYTGATAAVNLGAFDLTVNGLTVGRGAGSISTNTVLGATALSSNTTGASNVAIGINSLNTNTTGGSNVAVGQSSLQTNNSNQNTAIGNQAMQFNTTGTANTGIGHTALQNNTTGNNNIAIGYESGKSITTGSNNTIIGNYAGTTTLANNIVLADGAGNIRYQWNGTNNVFGNPISGTSATFSGSISSDQTDGGVIFTKTAGSSVGLFTNTFQIQGSGTKTDLNAYVYGANPFGIWTNGSQKVIVTSGGNVGIGTNSPTALLHLQSSASTAQHIYASGAGSYSSTSFFNTTTGYGYDIGFGGSSTIAPNSFYIYGGSSASVKFSINSSGSAFFSSLGTGTVTATSGTLSTISDMNLKNEDGFINNALEKVMNLKPRYFHWKEESGLPTDLRQLGFFAQEVNEALGEEAANTPKTENDKWGIYDRGMIAFLTAAIQELKAELDILKNK